MPPKYIINHASAPLTLASPPPPPKTSQETLLQYIPASVPSAKRSVTVTHPSQSHDHQLYQPNHNPTQPTKPKTQPNPSPKSQSPKSQGPLKRLALATWHTHGPNLALRLSAHSREKSLCNQFALPTDCPVFFFFSFFQPYPTLPSTYLPYPPYPTYPTLPTLPYPTYLYLTYPTRTNVEAGEGEPFFRAGRGVE